MKPMRLLMLPMLVLGLGGCVLMGPSYTEPVDFDLGVPAAEAVRPAALPIRFGVFRNLSGSNRGFLVRESGDRLSSDEYNRWLLSPELLAAANPHRTAGPGGRDGKKRAPECDDLPV